MRVLLVNYEFPGVTENCGGGGEVTRQLAQGLSDRGHDVRVVTDAMDGHHVTFPVRTYGDVRAGVRDFAPDVVNGHFSLPSSLLLPAAARGHDAGVVVSCMGADVYDPTRYQRLRAALAVGNKYLARRADRVVAPSTDMQERWHKQTGAWADRVAYGIDPSEWRWRSRSPPGRPRVLSVCRLVERKNLEAGVDAVSRVRARGVDAEYRIVGTGPQRQRLENAYANRDWVSFAGYVEDLQAEFDQADLFLLPSLHEAFGVVLLEALACGLPVVASGVGGPADIVTDRVGVTCRPEAQKLAAGLQTVLDDYERFQRGTNGYVAGEFHVEQMVDAYEQVYQEVSAGARSRA